MVRNRKAFELFDVSKSAENGPFEFGAEIYFSGRAIAERWLCSARRWARAAE